MYTRDGAFTRDAEGTLATRRRHARPGLAGRQAGDVDTNAPVGPVRSASATCCRPCRPHEVDLGGNLSADAAIGTTTQMTVTAYDEQGVADADQHDVHQVRAPTSGRSRRRTARRNTAVALTDNVLTFDGAGELTAPADRNIEHRRRL